ncbi:MAG: bile acid:sodium symporter family protein [Candidatus Binatia bacterium]
MDSTHLLGPVVLFALMIVVGLQLTPADFRRVLAAPRAVVGGTVAQLVLLPLMTWGVLSAVDLSPAFGAGAVLLAASPGAAMSNVMTAVAGAHVALSVTLTAVSSVLAVVTLPALTALGMALFLGDAIDVEVPVAQITSQLFLFLLLPIGVGMTMRARRPETAARSIGWANRVAVVGILALTALGAVSGGESLPSGAELAWAAVAALAWTLVAMAIGWSVASLLGLDESDRFTFLIEFSARNVALAVVVALSSFGRLDLALFSGVYAMTGFPLVIGLSVLRGWRAPSALHEPDRLV